MVGGFALVDHIFGDVAHVVDDAQSYGGGLGQRYVLTNLARVLLDQFLGLENRGFVLLLDL